MFPKINKPYWCLKNGIALQNIKSSADKTCRMTISAYLLKSECKTSNEILIMRTFFGVVSMYVGRGEWEESIKAFQKFTALFGGVFMKYSTWNLQNTNFLKL